MIFVLILIALLILAVPLELGAIGIKYLMKKGHATAAFAVIGIAALGSIYLGYEIYIAVYPNDNFYEEEFERNTSLKFPMSGKIIMKDATYPDQHGDYWSSAVIQFSNADYERILKKVARDSVFAVNSEMYPFVTDLRCGVFIRHINRKDFNCVFSKTDAGFEIGFLKDNKSIVINRH